MTREQLIERINELEEALNVEKSTSDLWYKKMQKYESAYNHLILAFNDLAQVTKEDICQTWFK